MRIDRRDLELLGVIADYRVMTFKQLAVAAERDSKVAHRRVGDLAGAGLIVQTDRKTRSGRGRREKLISVAPGGVALLRDAKVLSQDGLDEDVTLAGLPHVEHQLLLNWVRIHWLRIDQLHPALRVRFVPHSSPMVHLGDARANGGAKPVPVFIRSEGGETFTPDAVATITDVERGKTVLFFVEIDMGTEPFDTPGKSRTTIVQKIQKYQRYFQAERYRDYESVCDCSLRGFRVLFVTNAKTRSAFLSQHLVDIRPREFIWITDEAQLSKHGVGASIWARGGQQGRPSESILGSRAGGVDPVTAAVTSQLQDG